MTIWLSKMRHPFRRFVEAGNVTTMPPIQERSAGDLLPERLQVWTNRLAWPLVSFLSAEVTYCLWFECDYPQSWLATAFTGVFLVIAVAAASCAVTWWLGWGFDVGPEFSGEDAEARDEC